MWFLRHFFFTICIMYSCNLSESVQDKEAGLMSDAAPATATAKQDKRRLACSLQSPIALVTKNHFFLSIFDDGSVEGSTEMNEYSKLI